jgi:hypothetical protein
MFDRQMKMTYLVGNRVKNIVEGGGDVVIGVLLMRVFAGLGILSAFKSGINNNNNNNYS